MTPTLTSRAAAPPERPFRLWTTSDEVDNRADDQPPRRESSARAPSVDHVPSRLHESLVEFFRQQPSLVPELLAGVLGMALPDHQQVRLESGDCTDVVPTEYRADAVVVLTHTDRPVLAVVVEVQLQTDPHKRWSWPVYVATLRARLRCPTVLLVVCVDAGTAASCAAPIDLGNPGSRLVPSVLGPDRVPVIATAERAATTPDMAVLSAMAHGGHPRRRDVLEALLAAFAAVDERRATLYSDLVHLALPLAARRYLEALVSTRTYEYKSEFVRKYVLQGRAEGRAEGEATALLAILDARGIEVPEEARTRITGCTNLDQLEAWVRRAATAEKIDELFV